MYAVGTRVRILFPNARLGAGVVIKVTGDPKLKPLAVQLDTGEIRYFHIDQVVPEGSMETLISTVRELALVDRAAGRFMPRGTAVALCVTDAKWRVILEHYTDAWSFGSVR